MRCGYDRPRENVLRLRFGLDDGKMRTLEDVGKAFNVTRERIARLKPKPCVDSAIKPQQTSRDFYRRLKSERAEGQKHGDYVKSAILKAKAPGNGNFCISAEGGMLHVRKKYSPVRKDQTRIFRARQVIDPELWDGMLLSTFNQQSYLIIYK